MLHVLASLVMLPSPVKLETRITEMSVFRPGLALVVREATLPVGRSSAILDRIPLSIDGSFWYDSPDGANLTDVTTNLSYEEETTQRPAVTVGDYLTANVGKTVTVTRVLPNSQTHEKISAKLQFLGPPPNGYASLQLANGQVETIPASTIVGIDPSGLDSTVRQTRTVPLVTIAVAVDTKAKARLRVMSLEGGGAWNASHLVSIKADGLVEVVSKAQLAVAQHRLDRTHVRAMTGLPVLPKDKKLDLATGTTNLQAYLAPRGSGSTPMVLGTESADPYQRLNAVQYAMQNAQQNGPIVYGQPQVPTSFPSGQVGYGGGGFGGGGFGGGGFGGGGFGGDESYSNRGDGTQLARVEDLFEFDLGEVSLEPGGRLTRVLSSHLSKSENVYIWTPNFTPVNQYSAEERAAREESNLVKKVLRISNETGTPWADGTALVIKGTTPLAQTKMPFTVSGKQADVVLGSAQDMLGQIKETELSRSQPFWLFGTYYTRVQNQTTLKVENTRKTPEQFEIHYKVLGEVTEADGAEIRKVPHEGSAVNPMSVAVWRFALAAGESREYKATYTQYRP